MNANRSHRGLSLIELLVVFTLIAIMAAILLPTLSRAREHSQSVVCLTHMRETIRTFTYYAEDEDVIPGNWLHGRMNLDWCGLNNQDYVAHRLNFKHPMHASVLRLYIYDVDDMLRCPSVRRHVGNYFDYTMVVRMAGARDDLPWKMSYPLDPSHPDESRHFFRSLPLLVEEDTEYYNEQLDNGVWANNDQITDRHDGFGTIAFLDGSIDRVKTAKGSPYYAEEYDLQAKHLRLWTDSASYTVHRSNMAEFGWANRLRP